WPCQRQVGRARRPGRRRRWPPRRFRPGCARPVALRGPVHLTMPLTAWLGLTQSPGEIAGFGPVTRQTSRTLADRIGASLRSRWCLTLTDAAGHAIGHGCARRPPPGGADSDRIADWLASLKIGRMEAGVCSHAREVPRYRI